MKKAVMSLLLVVFMVLCAIWIAQATPNDTRVIFSDPIFLNNVVEAKTAYIKVTPITEHGKELEKALKDTLVKNKGVTLADPATAFWTVKIFAGEIATKTTPGKWFFNTVTEHNLKLTLMITEHGKEQRTIINVTGRDTLDMASVAEAIAGLF